METSVTDATAKVHAILEPLSSDERRRVTQAAMILLGEDARAVSATPPTSSPKASAQPPTDGIEDPVDFPVPAQRWMSKHNLARERLEQFFHFDDNSVKPIELPGNVKGLREKTINTYLTLGAAALLQAGKPSFSDEDARNQCKEFGCYDMPNHAKHLKCFGNQIAGSKSKGWKLTAPGLVAAAHVLKSDED